MGEFHKLGNLHQIKRVAKRFLKIHLEKHATAYLKDTTPPAKLQGLQNLMTLISAMISF